jgi:homoserine kinase type II
MAILTVPREDELLAFTRAHDLGDLRSSQGIEAGTVNTSYVLYLGDPPTKHFLRIYEEQGHAGAAREAELLVHLAAAGVPTPAPLRGRDGAFVRTVAGKPAALFPWAPGEMLCQRAVTPEAGRKVGAALARVHLAGPAPGSALGPGRFGPKDLVARCDRVAASKDPEARAQADRLRQAVLDVAARRRPNLPSGLVHGDLFRDNVLWADGAISALLDFESAHTGPFVYDVAVLMLSWAFSDHLEVDVMRAIAEGYRSVRPLEPREAEALHDEAVLATLRFTITRITDEAIRVGKKWQRFVARREAVERLGPAGMKEIALA